MIHLISEVIEENRPDLVLVYGDTNSTLAGTISALQHFVPVAHVEAGMRSRNFRMPEEINRVLVDRVSALNFAPSASAMSNLAAESLDFGSHQVGDIVADVVRRFEPNARLSTSLANEIKFSDLAHNFALATFHRQGTLDTPRSLEQLVQGLNAIAKEIPIVLPTHPRLAMRLEEFGLSRLVSPNILMISPLGFLEMLALLKHASVVLTDSGGLQKEAFYAKVPCVTVRSETEWTETVELGWNRLSSVDPDSMLMAFSAAVGSSGLPSNPYGDGHTSEKIIEILLKREWTNFFS
jgi:UDP-GlcNAc3NAcA epimerase